MTHQQWAIPAVCRPLVHLCCPRSYHTLCPRSYWSTPPPVPPALCDLPPASHHHCCRLDHDQRNTNQCITIPSNHFCKQLTMQWRSYWVQCSSFHQYHQHSPESHHTQEILGCNSYWMYQSSQGGRQSPYFHSLCVKDKFHLHEASFVSQPSHCLSCGIVVVCLYNRWGLTVIFSLSEGYKGTYGS